MCDVQEQMLVRLILFVFSIGVTWIAIPDAEACDSPVYNDVFSMADSADRVLLVQGTSFNKAKIVKSLKGSAVVGLPAIKSNCDPHLQAGSDYLLFIRKGGYYSDTSALMLLGDRGKRWTRSLEAWIAATTDAGRSAVLHRLLRAEMSELPLHRSEWRMLRDLANSVPARRSFSSVEVAKVKAVLSTQKQCALPHHIGYLKIAKKAKVIALVRASSASQATISKRLFTSGKGPVMSVVSKERMSPGVQYLVLLGGKGKLLMPPLLAEDSASLLLAGLLAKWAQKGYRPHELGKIADASTLSLHSLCADGVGQISLYAQKRLHRP